MAVSDRLQEVRIELHQGLTQVRQEMNENLLQTRDKTDQRLQALQESNEQRLEQMRQTVEEKLEKTLQTRLQASFETVSKQLESVNRGLGEMQTVARDVGALNKVLSGTKTRGILGELQLGQIIEDIMTPAQYEREFATVKIRVSESSTPSSCQGKATKNMFIYQLTLSFHWRIITA